MLGKNKGLFDILCILVFRTMGTRCDNAADLAFLVHAEDVFLRLGSECLQ